MRRGRATVKSQSKSRDQRGRAGEVSQWWLTNRATGEPRKKSAPWEKPHGGVECFPRPRLCINLRKGSWYFYWKRFAFFGLEIRFPTHLPFKIQTSSEKISWTFPSFLLNNTNRVSGFNCISVYTLLNKCLSVKCLNQSNKPTFFPFRQTEHTYQYDWTSHWTDLAGHLTWRSESEKLASRM